MIPRNNTAFTLARTSWHSTLKSIALSVVLVVAGVLVIPQNLMAHARLVKSEPAASSKGPAPKRIRLTFSESLVLSMTRLHLVGPSGDTIELDAVRLDSADSHSVIAGVDGSVASGLYTLSWAVAARDGHPSRGSFAFTVIGPVSATDAARQIGAVEPTIPAVPAPTQPRDSATSMLMPGDNSVGMIIVRWIAFLSTFLIVGAVTFRLFLLRRSMFDDGGPFVEIASTNAATLGLVASVGMLVSLILKIVRESADMPDVSTLTMLFASTWGWSLCCALLASLAGILAFVRAGSRSGPAALQGWRIALVAAVALAVTPALSGHAIGSDLAWINVPADIIHVVAGSMWLGTLTVIVIVGISAALKAGDSTPARARIAQMINAFSPMGLTCGAIVVATGVVASLIHLPRINALWTTPYGSALYRKLVFVLLLFAVGAWNWRRTKPRLNADGGLAPLRRAATIEIVLATIVLGLTAILVALAIPE